MREHQETILKISLISFFLRPLFKQFANYQRKSKVNRKLSSYFVTVNATKVTVYVIALKIHKLFASMFKLGIFSPGIFSKKKLRTGHKIQ